jgi:TolB-like protein
LLAVITSPAFPQAAGENPVLLLPFSSTGAGGDESMGKAVQQDLLADLTQGTTARIFAPASVTAAVDAEGALKTARGLGASIVVFGQIQRTGTDVRLTGEVLDAATAKPLGALKATGPADELFHLEDALAGQVFLSLPRGLLTAQTLQGMQQAANSPQPSAATPQQPSVPPASNPSQATAPPTSYQAPPTVYSPPIAGGGDVYAPPQYVYPTYSYNYYQTPVPDYYAPAYTYVSPGCDLWPGFCGDIVLGGFGGFGGYCGYGYGYGSYGHGGYGYNHYGDHHYGGGHGLNGGVHQFGGGLGGLDRGGVAQFSPVRSAVGARGFAGSNFQSHLSSGFSGGFSAASRSAGGFRSFSGATRGFSGGGYRAASGGFRSGGGFHAGGGGFHAGGGGFHGGGGGFHGGGGSHGGGHR